MLRIHDTARRAVVEFVPREPGRVSMYVCGPTPYDVPHLGHGRKEIVFDTIRRYLTWRGFEVTYVSNVTDIEDKIIAKATAEGSSEPEVARRFGAEFRRQFDRMNVLPPTHEPHATEWIVEMVALIADLVDRGHAYVVEGQGVYFAVESLGEYGALSHRTVSELLEGAGARVDVDDRKRSPIDFALWKAAKPGEPTWESPWGPGRPGWHIECSAMSLELLGDGFDIHGGGDDLVFPHHENEIAQAVGAGHAFARHWLHNGMVNVDGEKMSKSLGNFTTLGAILDRFGPRAFRLLVLQTHYRRQMELGDKELADAGKAAERVDTLFRRAARAGVAADEPSAAGIERFRDAMDDDFDTPGALAVVFEAVRDSNSALDAADHAAAAAGLGLVEQCWTALGLWIEADSDEVDHEVDALVAARDAARAAKDWAEADRLRDELAGRGVVLEDTPDGTVWRRARPDDE